MKYQNTNDDGGPSSYNPECSVPSPDKDLFNLRADCENCFGLCCVALYFSTTEGFPEDKEAGQPCINLQTDFRCSVYPSLRERGLKGCIAFDCFGAGQKVSQISFSGNDWQNSPASTDMMFKVFLIMRHLHELLWYLTDALNSMPARSIHGAISAMLEKTESLTLLDPASLVGLDLPAHREEVNNLLVKTSKLMRTEARRVLKVQGKSYKSLRQRANLIAANLRGMDLTGANLRGACLIAADLRGANLNGVDCIGADLRDTDLRGADLSGSIFLTQAQLNTARGDHNTKLPSSLTYPGHWE